MSTEYPAADRKRWLTNDEPVLARYLESARGFLERARSERVRADPESGMEATLAQLGTVLDEMTAAAAELRARNRALADENRALEAELERYRQLSAKEADAVESERRLHVEQTGRAAAETAERQARFLADIGRSLNALLDAQAVAEAAARLAAGELGDVALVDLAVTGRGLRRAAVQYASDPELEPTAHLLETDPPATHGIILNVIESVKGAVLHPLSPDDAEAIAPRRAGILERLHLDTAVVLPLPGRDSVLGTLTLLARGVERSAAPRFDLAVAFADRLALALDNARLFDEANKASQAKSSFISVMSHEFRTPLTSILGYADLLLTGAAGPLNPVQQRHAERLRQSAWHLTVLVDDVLVFSRAASTTTPLRFETITCASLLEQVVATLRPVADAKGLSLHLERANAGVTFRTDPGRLRQVLINIGGNAIKFTEQGEVRIGVAREGRYVAFIVRDTGIGMTKEELEHIFEPFWRANRSETTEHAGTGLGLAVARDIIAALEGSIEVTSEPGVGTTFTARLPIG